MPTIDQLNALALAETMHRMHEEYDARFQALENQIETLKTLVNKQNATLGNVFQQMMGSGSTVRE